MGLIDVLPEKVEQQIAAVLTDVQLKLHQLDPVVARVPKIVEQLEGLIVDARAELAAIKRLRERWQAAAPEGQ